jgi:hypothetical protein
MIFKFIYVFINLKIYESQSKNIGPSGEGFWFFGGGLAAGKWGDRSLPLPFKPIKIVLI